MYPTPTGIIWPTEIGVTSTGAMAAKDLLPIFPLGGSVGRSIDRRQHWVSPGSEFMEEFAEKLRHLQEAANGYAEEQLDFAFGEKYKRPKFEGVSFGDPDTVKLELTLITQKTRGMKGWTVMFKFKVIVASGTEKEEIEFDCLYQKVGQLRIEADWLKKRHAIWDERIQESQIHRRQ